MTPSVSPRRSPEDRTKEHQERQQLKLEREEREAIRAAKEREDAEYKSRLQDLVKQCGHDKDIAILDLLRSLDKCELGASKLRQDLRDAEDRTEHYEHWVNEFRPCSLDDIDDHWYHLTPPFSLCSSDIFVISLSY